MGTESVPGVGAGAPTAWYVIPGRSYLVRWFNVLHWPFTAWHVSYVIIGASLANTVNLPVLGWTVLAFFLRMGVAAHCFDLLKGDPLRLGLPPRHLVVVGFLGLGGAISVGLWQVWAGNVPWQLVWAVPIGGVLAVGYGKEWPGLHGDWQFAAWWAGFPLLVAYFAQGIAFTPALVPAVGFALATAAAQRALSARARYLRREAGAAYVRLWMLAWPAPGVQQPKVRDKAWLLQPLDQALMLLSFGMVAAAAAMLAWRW